MSVSRTPFEIQSNDQASGRDAKRQTRDITQVADPIAQADPFQGAAAWEHFSTREKKSNPLAFIVSFLARTAEWVQDPSVLGVTVAFPRATVPAQCQSFLSRSLTDTEELRACPCVCFAVSSRLSKTQFYPL